MEYGILGPLAVWREGRELRLGPAKQRAVLALLVLRRNELVPTERLMEDLWGGQPSPTALEALRNSVSSCTTRSRQRTRHPLARLRAPGREGCVRRRAVRASARARPAGDRRTSRRR